MTRLILSLIFLTLLAGVALAVPPDGDTLLYASFDQRLGADLSAGASQPQTSGDVKLAAGKYGQALAVGQRGAVRFPAAGNLNLAQGTVAFWVRPAWLAAGVERPALFVMTTDAGGYRNINIIPGNRLGIAARNRAGEPFVWRRTDRTVDGWQPTEWHHLAATWTDTELRFFIDGEEVPGAITDMAPLEGVAGDFQVGSPAVVIDEFSISAVARTAEQIREMASATPQAAAVRFMCDLKPVTVTPEWLLPAVDAQPGPNESRLALAVGGQQIMRGLGTYAPQMLSYHLDGKFARLQGLIGASDFSPVPEKITFIVSGDGKPLFTSQPLAPGQAAVPLDVDVSGVKTLVLETRAAAGLPMAVWGGMLLTADKSVVLPIQPRPLPEDLKAFSLMKRDAGRYTFALPASPKGYALYAWDMEDRLSPDAPPPGAPGPRELTALAAPGQYETVGLALYAGRFLPQVRVSLSDFTGDGGQIKASEAALRVVARVPMRRGYWMKPEPANYDVVARFAFPAHPFMLRAGEFQQLLADIHVPPDAKPGQYRATLSLQIGEATEQVPLVLRVVPIKLSDSPKRYGMYYGMRETLERPEQLAAELADMQRHGITTVWTGLGPLVSKEGEAIKLDFDPLRRMLTTLRAHGFRGTLPVMHNLMALAGVMGHPVKQGEADPTLETDAAFMAEAKRVFSGLDELANDFPEFDLVVSHMDEVFTPRRFPQWLQFAQLCRQFSTRRLFITCHTTPTSPWRDYMTQAAPYLDIPCFNGHALDSYLQAGGSFGELGQMLAGHKMEGWMYYNIRGSFFTDEWMRIVNGLYLWQSPLTVHIPWMYYSVTGDAFDDTDAVRHDFVYATPSREDPTVMIPSLHYLALRAGRDDVRYIYTLQELAAKATGAKQAEAQRVLQELAQTMPRVPEDLQGIELESPYLIALSDRMKGEDYRAMRRRLAEAILKAQ